MSKYIVAICGFVFCFLYLKEKIKNDREKKAKRAQEEAARKADKKAAEQKKSYNTGSDIDDVEATISLLHDLSKRGT